MLRYQHRLGRLGAVGVFVVASAFAWAPSAPAATLPSSHAVGVVPGPLITSDSGAPCGKFAAPDYHVNTPGETLPALQVDWFESTSCSSAGYSWSGIGRFDSSALRVVGITPGSLSGLDTLVLYGVRWDSIDDAGHAAINDFARTHKVVFWDADSTVPKPGPSHTPNGQDYRSYQVPFETFASGGQKTTAEPPVQVTPGDMLNAPKAIVEADLAHEPHAIGDMTVMRPTDPSVWNVSIRAKNDTLDQAPGGAPSDIVLAWARGDQATATGLSIYSGIDADALDLTPTQLGTIPRNEALVSFQNQLAAGWCTAAPCTVPQQTRSILIFQTGGGSGTVSASPPGSRCGALCYDQGTTVTLAAFAGSDSVFAGWSGACSGSGPTCTVTMNTDVSLTATFVRPNLAPHRLSVTKSGDGQGTVTSSPVGLDCGAVCAANFLSGSAVTLTATPAPGSVFLGWTGACVGNAGCPLILDADRAVSAVFSTQARRCSMVSRTAWLHGVVLLKGSTNVPGATAVQALSSSGKQVGASTRAPSAFNVNVDTRKLPTNRTSSVRVRVMNGTAVLCSSSISLRVDNTKARALKLTQRRQGRYVLISFRPTEAVTVHAYGKGKKPTTVRFTSTKRHTVRVLAGVKRARVQLVDRARNLHTVFVTLH